ncbi:MarR family transcriptional regulator [Alkaliflexus imshenetskii]|uniref:MarR family transcriptional regulator n=1 Tax=Alkaliflexus imshenetskii TaxID=286730 RepID=UPI00047A348E|nr:MarR family transcriptional regulator [Alkaliflexus imshenetskii]
MNTTDAILDAMKKAGKPLKAGEIAELSGIDKKEVEKGMKQLQKDEKIVSPKRCFWEPK